MSVFQTAQEMWAWMMTEKAFMGNALQGIGISLSFAFLVMFIYTRSLVQTLIAISCVAFIMVSMICLMVLKDWEMGISESIAIVLLIGLSVDYVIHLAAHYVNSKEKTRLGRMRESYREIAISITSGAITSFGCGLFLFGGNNLVFQKFAILICSTIAFSFIISMLLFGSMISMWGSIPDNTKAMEEGLTLETYEK